MDLASFLQVVLDSENTSQKLHQMGKLERWQNAEPAI